MNTQSPSPKDSKTPLPAHSNGAATDGKPTPAALPMDLEGLPDEALVAVADEAPRLLARRKAKREADFFDAIREQARILNIPPARLAAVLRGKSEAGAGAVEARDRRSDVKPVYRDPVTGDTWAGRGQPPSWIAFGEENNPKTGKPLPLRKFWISEQEKK